MKIDNHIILFITSPFLLFGFLKFFWWTVGGINFDPNVVAGFALFVGPIAVLTGAARTGPGALGYTTLWRQTNEPH